MSMLQCCTKAFAEQFLVAVCKKETLNKTVTSTVTINKPSHDMQCLATLLIKMRLQAIIAHCSVKNNFR